MTIVEAILEAMKEIGEPASYVEIHEKIVELELYTFGAKQPESVVRVQLKLHTKGHNIPSAKNKIKYFESFGGTGRDEKFYYLDEAISPPIKDKNTDGKPENSFKKTIVNPGFFEWLFLKSQKTLLNFSLNAETHKTALHECAWMLVGAFIPIVFDSLLRSVMLNNDFTSVFYENIKG